MRLFLLNNVIPIVNIPAMMTSELLPSSTLQQFLCFLCQMDPLRNQIFVFCIVYLNFCILCILYLCILCILYLSEDVSCCGGASPCLRAVHPPPRPCPPSTQPYSISSSFLLYFLYFVSVYTPLQPNSNSFSRLFRCKVQSGILR